MKQENNKMYSNIMRHAALFCLLSGIAGCLVPSPPTQNRLINSELNIPLAGKAILSIDEKSIVDKLIPVAQELTVKFNAISELYRQGAISRESAEWAFKSSFELQDVRSSVGKVISSENATSEEKQKAISTYRDKLGEIKSVVENLQPTYQKDLKLTKNFDNQWKNCDDSHFSGQAKADYEFMMSGGIIVKIVKSVEAHNALQVCNHGVSLNAGKKYALRIVVDSNSDTQLAFNLHKPSHPWTSYTSNDPHYVNLEKGMQVKDAYFSSNITTDMARITFYFGQMSVNTSVDIKNVQLFEVM